MKLPYDALATRRLRGQCKVALLLHFWEVPWS